MQLREAFPHQNKGLELRGVPATEAAIAIAAGNGARAVEQAKSFDVFKRGRPALTYLSARAHLLDKQPAKALADWDRLAQVSAAGFWKTIATVGRARASAQLGDVAAARALYREVLDVWEAAESNLPLLAEVKDEYAKLPQ
jgi:hypothetical protein